jgi:putative ABC transport system permease protein
LLRLAARDALRNRGRSVLVLVMIALPVLGVTAADVVIHTADVSGTEAVSRRIGAADAAVSFTTSGEVWQTGDPDDGSASNGGAVAEGFDAPLAIKRVLGPGVRIVERNAGSVRLRTPKGLADVEATRADLADPLMAGLFRRVEGRIPVKPDEVAVNAALRDRMHLEVGGTVELEDGRVLTVTGILRDASTKSDRVWVPTDGVRVSGPVWGPEATSWLVDAGRAVTWSDVRRLNKVGGAVISRHVLAHPPPASEIPPEMSFHDDGGPISQSTGAVIALVVVMALLEVVLLAGPAFAVGARRQSHTLALMAATGATPRHLRRVVLAGAVVLGSAAAAIGVVLGIAVAYAALPVAQQHDGSYFGPFDIRPVELLAIALFGVVSAVLAAGVPAWLAARQDVVAVLGGRRGDPKPRARSPLAGALLLATGIAMSVAAASQGQGSEVLIAGSAVVAVLGMILLIPVVLAVVARLARALPLPLRYAVRDAARHRTRTVPAVAAVAATVVGVVALGIGASSDELESRRTYVPRLAAGTGSVSNPDVDPFSQAAEGNPEKVWPQMVAAVRSEFAADRISEIRGLPDQAQVTFSTDEEKVLLDSYGAWFSTSVLVAEGGLPAAELGVPDDMRARADEVLAGGGAVVFTSRAVPGDHARMKVIWNDLATSKVAWRKRLTVPALFVQVSEAHASALGVVSADIARRLGVKPVPAALAVDGPISRSQERDVDEALAAISTGGNFYVERGYQQQDSTVVLLLVLGALGGMLMLGGTLTATFLALSDARSDLATLAAVGASGRSRRLIAAAYAGTVGLIGATLGAAVGFVPGIAVTYPLTGVDHGMTVDAAGNALPSHFVDVPWLLVVGVVILLPLVTSLVVGLSARSRLPMVARLN